MQPRHLVRLDRKVISFRPAGKKFIQSISSNSPEAPQNAFLDIQGKIISTFDQYCTADDCVNAVIVPGAFSRIAAHLKKYLDLSDTKMTMQEGFNTYFDLDGDGEIGKGDFIIPQKNGALIVTASNPESTVSNSEFDWFRLSNNIPIQDIDFHDEMLLNLNDDRFVSYEKGCFLGQEIIARVHYRAKPPKKLVAAPLSQLAPQTRSKATSVTPNPQTSEDWGFVFAENK